jgi:hypothetical protein
MTADYTKQSEFSDPRAHAALFDALPADVDAIAAVVRNLVVHYRDDSVQLAPDRIPEIDLRWIDLRLDADQRRFGRPLAEPRPAAERTVGCCRDFSLMTVAALRHHGIPARTRIGFADYFQPDWHNDHVVVEYWNGSRWVFTDPELDPAGAYAFDPTDMPRLTGDAPFLTAAQAWIAYRRGEIDAEKFGVGPDLPVRGGWFLRSYVIGELAHRQRDEFLLWDVWGAMSPDLDGDLGLIDDIAALLIAADHGDADAELELTRRYATDPALHAGDTVECLSPAGAPSTAARRQRIHRVTRNAGNAGVDTAPTEH